jgi:hypothetical protein
MIRHLIHTRFHPSPFAVLAIGAILAAALSFPAFLTGETMRAGTGFFGLPDGWTYSLYFLPLALAAIVYKTLDFAERRRR